jgi:hypothetical protein
MPSDDREFAFSSRVPPKALKIKAPYKAWHYQESRHTNLIEPHWKGQEINAARQFNA